MIVTLSNGTIKRVPIMQAQGFSASKIELELRDVRTLTENLRRGDVNSVICALYQLEHRFYAARVQGHKFREHIAEAKAIAEKCGVHFEQALKEWTDAP